MACYPRSSILANSNFNLLGISLSVGSRNAGTPTFANVISRGKSVESLDASKTIGAGKKGKKSSQILLSTAGGRRY